MYLGNDLSRGRSTIYHFDASGSETAITTATRPAVTISYTVGWVAVYLNGVRLHDTDYTATTGNSITGLAALSAGDVVIIEAAHTFSVADSVPATGGTFSGNVTHSGTVAIPNVANLETAVVANTAKVSNATHTGDVTGSNALTIATNAVDIAMLSATGTASSSTFLRGDNAWEAAGGITSIEFFYPTFNVQTDEQDARDGFLVTGNAAGSDACCLSGVAPAGITSVSSMYLWWICTDAIDPAPTLQFSWNIAANGQTLEDGHSMTATTMSNVAAVEAYEIQRVDILNEAETNDFEDLIAANDAFGMRFTSTHPTVPVQFIGVAIKWSS